MSISEMAKVIGTEGAIVMDGVRVYVRVLDVKQAYGNIRYLVTPLAGLGQTWVSAERVGAK